MTIAEIAAIVYLLIGCGVALSYPGSGYGNRGQIRFAAIVLFWWVWLLLRWAIGKK